MHLKGRVARDFRHSVFFHQSSPPKDLIQGLKPYCIWLRIRRENRLYSNFIGVIDIAEMISAVSLILLKQFPWCH
jgi:hypothetical protein